ncbi:hypothetical protein FQA47_023492 [Oryzias melastigma]|uniref:Uncharacterized protein n=1 Tax=Oryzias melastigma TaxID=30732 RepID=A0A834FME0_ORYME|nr:hypothetical protein FQA47_023492 [Oryzias melastigma]
MLFCALASVKAAPRGAAERLAESAGLLRRRDAQNARQPRTRFETRIIKGIKAPWTTAEHQRRTRRADAQVRIQKERRKKPATGRHAAANCLLGSLRDFENTT